MKQRAALLVVAFAFLLAMVVSGTRQVNSVVTTIHANCNSASALVADGNNPTPPLPPPPGTTQNLSTSTLRADGNNPTPPLPPPPGTSQNLAQRSSALAA
jgi:hypothetical protein